VIQVSIIIPARNEAAYIANALDSILANDYPTDNLEIIVADGMSTDGTKSITDSYVLAYPNIKRIDNPDIVVPHGLNAAIKVAKGNVIIRMDAHSIYPANYISSLTTALIELNADNVGGVWITKPANDTCRAKAVAIASSSKFGVGNAQYRINTCQTHTPIETDTVPFGCYNADVFKKIGFFDEDLIRNQDDEFNARLKQSGGKILLLPWVKIDYFARPTLNKAAKMFFQYGLFKPLVNKKLKHPATVRQFIPPLFVLYIFALIASMAILGSILSYFSILPFLLYLMVDLFFSAKSALSEKNPSLLIWLLPTYFIIHSAYGFGYLYGILKFLIFKNKVKNIKENR